MAATASTGVYGMPRPSLTMLCQPKMVAAPHPAAISDIHGLWPPLAPLLGYRHRTLERTIRPATPP